MKRTSRGCARLGNPGVLSERPKSEVALEIASEGRTAAGSIRVEPVRTAGKKTLALGIANHSVTANPVGPMGAEVLAVVALMEGSARATCACRRDRR